MSKNKKILIVEDEPFLSEMYQTKFASLGYEVISADTGLEGIEMMKKHKPSLVLLDVIMPVMDGYEVLRRVRADNDLKNQLIVMFTNLGQDEEVTKGLQMGADDYLVKSNLTPSQLVERVEAVLKRGRVKNVSPKSIRVLMITEDRALRETFNARFANEGFVHRIVEHGVYGLKVAQNEPFDVVVYDVTTSDIDAVEAITTIKQTPKMHDVPVLVLADDNEVEFVSQLATAGASDIFLKPRLTESQLVNKIRGLVNESKRDLFQY